MVAEGSFGGENIVTEDGMNYIVSLEHYSLKF